MGFLPEEGGRLMPHTSHVRPVRAQAREKPCTANELAPSRPDARGQKADGAPVAAWRRHPSRHALVQEAVDQAIGPVAREEGADMGLELIAGARSQVEPLVFLVAAPG